MEIKYDDIAKEIISLYCENKPERNSVCENRECQSGYCLCIDEEQIRLVSFFAGFSYDIGLKNSQMFIGSGKELEGNVFCKNQTEFTRKLIACKGRNPNELEKLVAQNKVFLKDQSFFKIIRTLPLIQSINALYPVEERGTISYLCLYGNEAGDFLKGLLSEMICQMVDEFIKNQSSKELLDTAGIIFGKITSIYKGKESEEFESVFWSNIIKYIECYAQEDQSLALVSDKLRKYYDELAGRKRKKGENRDACSFILENAVAEKGDILHRYCLLRKLTDITRLPPNKALDDFFKEAIKHITPHGIYDELENILTEFSKYDGVKRYKILATLKRMLSEEDGMCDEMLEDLKAMLRNTN